MTKLTGKALDRAVAKAMGLKSVNNCEAWVGLAEQPAQQVVDSNEKAGAYMDARLWEFIDMAAAWPKASPDPRTWNHVVVYAPKPAQQKPVAWRAWFDADNSAKWLFTLWPEEEHPSFDWQPLYTTPPQRTWVGLTTKEIREWWASENGLEDCGMAKVDDFEQVVRAIEAKLKEKNT